MKDSTNMVSFFGISTNMVREMQKKAAKLETGKKSSRRKEKGGKEGYLEKRKISRGGKRSFWLPLKKTGGPGAIFYCQSYAKTVPDRPNFPGRPQPSGRKAAIHADIAGIKRKGRGSKKRGESPYSETVESIGEPYGK